MDEEWREIPGYPDYEVSNMGRVRSWRNGKWGGPSLRSRMLKPSKNRGGYLCATLNGHRVRVHHLVLLAFIGPRPEGYDGCHNNNVRDDNRPENLRWDTRKNNLRQMVSEGRWKSPWERIGHVKR